MKDLLSILPFLTDVRTRPRDEQRTSRGADVDLTLTPEYPVVQQPTNLKLAFRRGTEPAKLTLSHERLFHAVIVSSSFDSFAHLHVEDFGVTTEDIEAGVFDLQYAFPHAGPYLVAIDFLADDEHTSRQFLVAVQGKAPEHEHDTARKQSFGQYEVELDAPQRISPGQDVTLRYTVSREGEKVEDLEPYLAAPMHLALIRDDLRSFQHVHGSIPGQAHAAHAANPGNEGEQLPERFGPVIEARVRFPKSGIYHVFGEFQHHGKPVVTQFVLEVK